MTTPEETGATAAEPDESSPSTINSREKVLRPQKPRSEGQMYRFSHIEGKMVPA